MTREEFLDVRNHGFFRVAVVSPRVQLGNPDVNARLHLEAIRDVYESGAQYVLGPELGGMYSLGDLHHNAVAIEGGERFLKLLLEGAKDLPIIVTVGAALHFDHFPVNAAVTFFRGQILAITPKEYLPNEGEFYEERHWAESDDLPFDEATVLGQRVPIGDRIIINCAAHPGAKIYVTVCEADWVPAPMSAYASLAGATIIGNVSASNVTIGKDEYREALFGAESGRYNGAYLYASAGFGESTSDHAWDGHIFVAERGSIVARGERFSLKGTSIVYDVDLGMLVADRRRQHSFRKNGRKWKKELVEFREVAVSEPLGHTTQPSVYNVLHRNINPTPFVPICPEQRERRCHEVFNMQVTSLIRRLTNFPPEKRLLVLGVSGGSDSTHAALVAASALDRMELPRTNLRFVQLPGYGTSPETDTDAAQLIEALGATRERYDIRDSCEVVFEDIGHTYDPANTRKDLCFQNTQAWMRMVHLKAYAAKHGGLVLGTGDLSELLIGWCTLFADHPLDYGINAGVAKTLILYLIAYSRDVVFKNDTRVREVLGRIHKRPISPELEHAQGAGNIVQKTEEQNGPYELHEFAAYYMLRFGFSPRKILRMALHTFNGKYTYAEYRRWLEFFVHKFFQSQFKRNIMADGPKIGLVCLSPRGDWRMPTDADHRPWLADLAAAPEEIA